MGMLALVWASLVCAAARHGHSQSRSSQELWSSERSGAEPLRALAVLLRIGNPLAAWQAAASSHAPLGWRSAARSGQKLTLSAATPASPALESEDGLEPEWIQFVGDDHENLEDLQSEVDPSQNIVVPKTSAQRRRRTLLRKKDPRHFVKQARARLGCYGCGAELQFQDPAAAGYVEEERYLEKAKYKQLRQLICNRCRQMSHGKILPAVVEGRLRSLGKDEDSVNGTLGMGVITPEQLRDELKPIIDQKVLAVLLVDVTDITGSFLPRMRDLIGGNPITLIATKADLLPKGTSNEQVLRWLYDSVTPFVNVIDAHLVSAKSSEGIYNACRSIMRDRRGRDVFVLGAANVGKSMFIGNFIENIDAGVRVAKLPISSSTPGTTLRLIPIDVFDGKSMLFDTPGLHLQHRLTVNLLPDELKAMIPRGRIKPYTPRPESGLEGCSFFWGGLARLDVLKAPLSARLTFLTAASNLRVTQHCEGGVQGAAEYYAAEVGRTLTPPLTRESAEDLGELKMRKRVELDLRNNQQECDISISGLGWISVGAMSSLRRGDMHTVIDVWVPPHVKVSLRSPMPVSGLPNRVDVEVLENPEMLESEEGMEEMDMAAAH